MGYTPRASIRSDAPAIVRRSGWAYYNEIDEFCVSWIRSLIRARLIPDGEVDRRSIKELTPDDLAPYTTVHLFCGIAGWPLAIRLAGWPDNQPIWTGSCPCQPFSVAGKGGGADDPRHLWPDYFRLVRGSVTNTRPRPPVLMGEQVSGADGRDWFDGVAADLESLTYSCRAVDIPACAINSPNRRNRLYWVAHPHHSRLEGRESERSHNEQECAAVERGGGTHNGLAHSHHSIGGPVQPTRHHNNREAAGRDQSHSHSRECGARHYWDDWELIGPDPSGNHRRIEPSLTPLVAGLPSGSSWAVPLLALFGVDPVCARRIADLAKANRIGSVRGYGNAINLELAAEVVRAYMDSINC